MALTADILLQSESEVKRMYKLQPLSNETFYKGSIVCANASGLAQRAADTVNFKCFGVAQFGFPNNVTVAEGRTVLDYIVVEAGAFWMADAGSAQTDVGKLFYVVDDATVALSSTNSIPAGRCIGFKTGFRLIDFSVRS
jgi:hypothetical protein